MASDISNIIKSELVSTVESLLSVTASVEEVVKLENPEADKWVKVAVAFEFSGNNSSCHMYMPTATGARFEHLMMGGMDDLKDQLDDDILDATKEIVSTISGSISTSVNAQGFEDVKGMKFTLGDSSIIESSENIDGEETYKFALKLNDDTVDFIIGFDTNMLDYLGEITGKVPESTTASSDNASPTSAISALLGDESVDNLKLLFDIKMRLSVRLGSKVCLLRDVISWDIGEIIEFTQMMSEPLDILVNGIVIGKGDPIIVEGKFGVKIKSIGTPKIN